MNNLKLQKLNKLKRKLNKKSAVPVNDRYYLVIEDQFSNALAVSPGITINHGENDLGRAFLLHTYLPEYRDTRIKVMRFNENGQSETFNILRPME